jgi:hypothetical protein
MLAYLTILVSLMLVGGAGLFFSTWSMLSAGSRMTPLRLTWGGVAEPMQLLPMREAGLLGPEEAPDIFVAETIDGKKACAVKDMVLLKLEDGRGIKVELRGAKVSRSGARVQVGEASCGLLDEEEAARFERMIREPG